MYLDPLIVVLPGEIPSWNNYIDLVGRNRFLCRSFTLGWKDWAEWHTWEYLDQEILDQLPLAGPVKCIVRVWRPNARQRDIHNLFLKPVFDAFTEVGLWPDDSEAYCPVVEYAFMGIDRANPRIEFEFRSYQIG